MSELSFQEQSVLWGQAYEVLVKRGVLACLADKGLIDLSRSDLLPWRKTRISTLYGAMIRHLGILDETVVEHVRSAAHHMAVVAYGLGYTAMREYLRKLERPLDLKHLRVRALWCPLTLPGPRDVQTERAAALSAVHACLELPGIIDPVLGEKGMPANADFLLWLSGTHTEDHLLVQEYSYDMPGELGDYREEEAHLAELMRYRRFVDSRGVFARVAAEVDEEQFELSDDIKTHLGALTSDNKPFYKLCQGSAYAESVVKLLDANSLLSRPCVVRALAITPNGLESLAARFVPGGTKDPRFALMEQLGSAYRNVRKLGDGDEAGLAAAVEGVFNGLFRRLPKELHAGLKALRAMPQPGEDYLLEFEEEVKEFVNPMQRFPIATALALVDESPTIEAYFGKPAKQAVAEVLGSKAEVSLRDLHAAAIIAAMAAAKPGRMNAIGLEGNPGIGKTTAVTRYLGARQTGYLLLYVSPRVVINRDVTEKLARKDGVPTGILTVTSNAQLIASAERWHLGEVKAGRVERRHIDGAVVVDGVVDLAKPSGSVLILDPEQEREIEAAHAGSRLSKTTLSENEDIVQERALLGVLAGMALTTRDLLVLNPGVERAVLTAALQGFRDKGGGKTTIQALSQLFKNPADRRAGVEERRGFAKRMPEIIVMVDELAGDGAGAPFVHAVTRWLEQEFIEPFGDKGSPFKVVLVVSDASLSNEVVLDRYLNAGDRTPDKVLVSRSEGVRPFRMTTTKVRLGSGRYPMLHVMTNSFPARSLSIQYKVNLSAVKIEEDDKGFLETPRRAIRRVSEELLADKAVAEVLGAVQIGSAQVIYFAQNKIFLREMRRRLALEKDTGLNDGNVAILDSSVPGWRRKQLLEEATRDNIKVFLMTSSGARGVSFPKTDVIIAAIPRFSIESSLMEVAQLIYRGRGLYRDENGVEQSGDHASRKLVMLIDDFLVHEEQMDKRQWLRQSLDLLTLLVMLRATIYTRITGDAGLKQSLALVPVGAVGLEELMSLMSQYVIDFVNEAETFVRGSPSQELAGLVSSAKESVIELFSRFRLTATARNKTDGFSFVRGQEAGAFVQQACAPVAWLLPDREGRPVVPDHVFFSGPLLLENWSHFEKREVFSFEGHVTQEKQMTRKLFMQLRDIDKNRALPSALRVPAANLFRLLAREKPDAANEFSTIKELKSPNTWISMPAAYAQFVTRTSEQDDRVKPLSEPDLWREGLGRALSSSASVMPAIPRYDEFPWAAGVGETNPLKFDLVFDDRYFMASSELNLLNTLLLTDSQNG